MHVPHRNARAFKRGRHSREVLTQRSRGRMSCMQDSLLLSFYVRHSSVLYVERLKQGSYMHDMRPLDL